MYQSFSIDGPAAVVTDRDLTLLNIIEMIMSRMHNILCAWHIHKNILA